MRWDKTGFTLIELIVVLALIALLAGLVVPNVVKYIGAGEQRAWEADREALQTAVDAYYAAPDNPKWGGMRQYPIYKLNSDLATTGGWPTDLDNGDPEHPETATIDSLTASTEIDLQLLLAGGYLKEVPRSASADNGLNTAVTETGSYTWFVNSGGEVKALYFYDKTKSGFQTGVYP